MQSIYQCPICKKTLEQVNKSLVCEQKHTYDVSSDGYVNLLLVNQKGSKNPGDNAFVAESRKNFLDNGYYDPLSDEINKIIFGIINRAGRAGADKRTCLDILDIGSGVGTYCGKFRQFLEDEKSEDRARIFGIDISKPAIQKAAKKYRKIKFCVGSNYRLPYMDESIDIIFSVFSPFDPKELFRVLKHKGKILLVRPGPNHLKELGELIYDKFELQGNPMDLSQNIGVSPVKTQSLSYEIHIKKNEDIMNLVNMTPYYWHLNDENRARLAAINDLKLSIDFKLSLFKKN